jgi:hypothetical protein
MIAPKKLPNALYALQAVLTHARFLAGKPDQAKLVVGLLDYAEYLPWLIANQADETARFREMLEDVAKRYSCAYVLRCFDDSVPSGWEASGKEG